MTQSNNTRVPRGFARLFIRKSVEQMHAEHAASTLKRSLSALNLVSLGIGCVIGTGIFVLTGRAAAEYAGPAIVLSFIITGLLCTLVALCYAELAAMLPVSGSAYSYSYASMGEIVAWVMGLLLVLEYGLAASTVAVGWSSCVVSLMKDIGVHIPPALKRVFRRARNNRDWTEGCIALNNEYIDEIWREVADGTPIEIRP